MHVWLKTTLIFIFGSSSAFAQSPAKDYIRLVDALDDPAFYCVDLSGRGDQLRLEDPLQTHTCKPEGQAEDQLVFHFDEGKLKVVGHDRCVQAAGPGAGTLPGSPLLARACSDSPLQKLSLHQDGKIHLDDSEFCLAAGSVSRAAGGPNQLWRTLTVSSCDEADEKLLVWQVGK